MQKYRATIHILQMIGLLNGAGLFIVRGGVKDRRGSLTPPRLEGRSCAVPAMATLFAPAPCSIHAHAARRLYFAASSDGLLYWLSKECSSRGLRRLGELLDDLLTERQSEQPEPVLDSELEALLPF